MLQSRYTSTENRQTHHQVPEEQGKSINIFDDDMWDELTKKRILRDMMSPMTAAGINQVATTGSRIIEAAGIHTAERIARSVLPLVSPASGASAMLEPFSTGTRAADAFSGITSASDHSRKIAMSAMAGIAGPNVGETVADYAASVTRGLQPILDLSETVGRWQDGLVKSRTPALQSMSTFTIPSSLLDQIPSVVTGLQHLADQQQRVFNGITKALRGYDHSVILKLKKSLLPPNLRVLADEISFGDVHDFLREEAIPLYLVPRAQTALRFLSAPDRPARLQILNDCFNSLVDDCEVVLEQVDHPDVKTEVNFALDGIAALRDGHTRAAQALITLIFDTLISRFFPDQKTRRNITNREPDAAVPETINGMGSRDVSVWLPVWNAHKKFWPNRGIPVPWEYSRHATVHKVSCKQYTQRNTIQSLMLVTSLIGYADRLELCLP